MNGSRWRAALVLTVAGAGIAALAAAMAAPGADANLTYRAYLPQISQAEEAPTPVRTATPAPTSASSSRQIFWPKPAPNRAKEW